MSDNGLSGDDTQPDLPTFEPEAGTPSSPLQTDLPSLTSSSSPLPTDLSSDDTVRLEATSALQEPTAQEVVAQEEAAHPRRMPIAVAAGAAVAVGAATWLGLGALDSRSDTGNGPEGDAGPVPQVTQSDGTIIDQPVGPWTVDWDGVYEQATVPYSPDLVAAPSSFDDGLDHANLPPLVDRLSPHFPQAHQLTDEVWRSVGPGWFIGQYSDWSYSASDYSNSHALDLVSSEGVHFALPDPPQVDGYGYPRVDYVNLAEGWAYGDASQGEGDGLELRVRWNLLTGALLSVYYEGAYWTESQGYGEKLDVAGPLAGGAELRLYRTQEEGEIAVDELTIWTPGADETPIALPDGATPGTLSLNGPISADGTLVRVTEITQGLTTRTWVFDLSDASFEEAFPVNPSSEGGQCGTQSIDDDSMVVDCYGYPVASFYDVPWDGSAPTALNAEEAFSVRWADAALALHVSDDGRSPLSIDDVTGSGSVAAFASGAFGVTWWSMPTVIELGQGRFIAFGGDWTNWGVAYDRATGTSFVLEPSWIPDTAASNRLYQIWFFRPIPGEE